MAAIVEAQSLSKRFGRVTAVDDLSFSVEPGKVTGFLGPNGAGKTTTLRMVLGLARPTKGQTSIKGVPFAALPDPAHTVGAVLERSGFHPGRSGRDHLRVLAAAAGIAEPRVNEVLELVDLSDAGSRRAGGYSMGMRQRLGLAAALLGDPELLVLDEPANGLDPQGIRWLRDLLRARTVDGKAVLVSSHLLSEVAQTVDEVIVIDHGRLVTQGSVEELTSRSSAGLHVRTPQAARLAELLAAPQVRIERDGADGLVLRGVTAEAVGDLAAANQIPIYGLHEEEASLEDAFLRLTADASDQEAS